VFKEVIGCKDGLPALLFCTDEKTAGLVTQVLNERISVEAANEPFAAVKRLTTQHFDRWVVDCENEAGRRFVVQSSAQLGPNRTSLAVAWLKANLASPKRSGSRKPGTDQAYYVSKSKEHCVGTWSMKKTMLEGSAATPQAPAATTSAAPRSHSPAFDSFSAKFEASRTTQNPLLRRQRSMCERSAFPFGVGCKQPANGINRCGTAGIHA